MKVLIGRWINQNTLSHTHTHIYRINNIKDIFNSDLVKGKHITKKRSFSETRGRNYNICGVRVRLLQTKRGRIAWKWNGIEWCFFKFIKIKLKWWKCFEMFSRTIHLRESKRNRFKNKFWKWKGQKWNVNVKFEKGLNNWGQGHHLRHRN